MVYMLHTVICVNRVRCKPVAVCHVNSIVTWVITVMLAPRYIHDHKWLDYLCFVVVAINAHTYTYAGKVYIPA